MNTVNMANPAANRPEGIRTWRVGSLSMGVTLMLLGTALAVSLWQDIEAYEMLMWVAPVVFIMLGAELLLGQVRYWSAEKLGSLDDKMLHTNIVGTTMYVMIGSVDRRDGGFISDTIDPQLTLVVPKGVKLVERGR